MNKENPVNVELRITTVTIIKKLTDDKITIKAAALKVYNLSRLKHVATGFPVTSFQGFYQAYFDYTKKYKEELKGE